MNSNARIDSVVFQLTPTRTRFELVISANEKTERIASGLLNPFLTHLKSAQEQIGKGGYSIILKPHRGSDATWFTKGTMERFVRFVSTPEILERVYTVESEISQIEDAISFQKSNGMELHDVQDQVNYKESSEANSRKPNNHVDAGKSGNKAVMPAIGEKAIVVYKPDAVALETDGFTTQGENSKTQLLKVLETRKGVLQKEQGMAFARAVAAGFDIDNIAMLMSFAECFGATRMMEACSRFVELWKAKHESGQWVEAVEEIFHPDSVMMNSFAIPNSNDKPKYIPGQFPHHSKHPPWPVPPQAGQLPVFQPYPLPMPYIQDYHENDTYFLPLYPSVGDSVMCTGQVEEQKDRSMDNGGLNPCLVTEVDCARHQVRKKGGKGARKQSGTVVINNLNYIASKKQHCDNSEVEDVDDDNDMNSNKLGVRNKNLRRRSEQNGNRNRSDDAFKQLDEEDNVSGHAGGDGHWQAFQTLLLRSADEEDSMVKRSMFAMEEKSTCRRQQAAFGDDPSLFGRQQSDGEVDNCHNISGDIMRGRSIAYRQTATESDELMVSGHVTLSVFPASTSDPFVGDQFGYSNVYNRGSPHELADESFIVPRRSSAIEQVGGNVRLAIDMDPELPLDRVASNNLTSKVGSESCEPYDLNMIPVRVTESGTLNFDPAMDYELQAAKVDAAKKSADVKKGIKKVDNPQGLKSQKKTTSVTKRGQSYKLSPAEEARARAERLRSFKADLLKQKKAQEEEQKRRLESLKIERQKRIAARSSSGKSARSPLPSPQAKKSLPSKLSPVSQKGSKFSDTEPGSASPLQRSTVKYVSRLSGDALKTSRPGRLDFGSHSGGNRLTRSASPLNGRKGDNNASTPDSIGPMAKIRRLSEPRATGYPASSITSPSVNSLSRKTIKGPERKKALAIVKSEINKYAALPEESAVNRLTRSASPFSGQKEEENGTKPDPKASSMARIRRLSEPKGISDLALTVMPHSQKPLSRRASKGSEMKNTPASVKSEISKSVAIPESNAKQSKALSEFAQKRSAVKVPTRKMNMKTNSSTFATLVGDSSQVLSKNEYDEKTVFEKTVVILECDRPSHMQASEENMHIPSPKPVLDPTKGKIPENVAAPAQISPRKAKGVDDKMIEVPCLNASLSNEARTACAVKVFSNISADSVTEQPYNAPYARVSSLDDPCMEKSEYAKAPPARLGMETASSELPTARVSSSMMVYVSDDSHNKLDKIWEVPEKHPEKEASKGFKRLLKFGRKKHSSGGEIHLELDQANHDEPSQDNTSSGPEVITLKELISQGEGSTNQTTPQKSSRSFSLLSPFRSKASEKKPGEHKNKTEG